MSVTGEVALRKEYVDTAIKRIAQQEMVLMELCTVDSSNAWTETYYYEDNADLVGGTNSAVKGVPRGAALPYVEPIWTKASSINLKYGAENFITFEDELMNNIPMIQRTLLKVGRAVAYAIDQQILSVMSASSGNSYAIGAGNEWDSATVANRDPIKDILLAQQTIRADNINPLSGNGYLVLNGTDWANVISNAKVSQNPTFRSDVTTNGNVGTLCGLKVKLTEVVAADTAYVIMAQDALVWKQAQALTVEQIRDPGIKTTIRAFAVGQAIMVNPNASCKITNTRA